MASRTRFGFPTSTGDATACCGRGLRARADTVVTGLVQCVDNLTVRNRLLSGHHFSGTVTVTGSGSANALTEAALCVQAGANFAGLTQHGQLSVVGNSCMTGPLAVSNLYGPVTVGADPSETNPAVTQLTVSGDSVILGALQSVQVDAAIGDIDVLTVAEGPVGPASGSLIAGRMSNTLVTVLLDTTYDNFVGVVAVAVSPTQFLTSLWYPTDSTGSSLDAFAVGDSYNLAVVSDLKGALAISATVTHTMPGANLALFTTDSGVGYNSAFVEVADELTDSPAPGTTVVVGYTDAAMGHTLYTVGVVADAHGQMFDSYTSLHVNVPNSFRTTRGVLGSPIFDYKNRLVGLVQYGTSDAAFPGTSKYKDCLFTGGAKARFIRYFLERVASSAGPDVLTLPVADSGRPILVFERGVAGLLPGGVAALNTYATTVSQSSQVLQVAAGSNVTHLGVVGPNNPSYPETVLKYAQASVSSLDRYVTAGGGTVTYTNSQVYTPTVWSNGTPQALCATGTGERSTNNQIIQSTPGNVEITNNTFVIQVTSSLTSTAFAVTTHGSANDKDTHRMVIVAWGNPASINSWFVGLGGAGLEPQLVEAWVAYYAGVGSTKPNLVWVGLVDNNFVFDSTTSASGLYNVTISKSSSAVTLGITQPSTSTTFSASYSYNSLYNIYDFITNATGTCTQFIAPTGATLQATTAGSSTVAIVDSTAPAGQLYP